jgi:hypothetical protein
VDRLVGDDLGAPLEHRQIEQDSGPPLGALLGGGVEQFDRAAADPAVLGALGVSAILKGIHFNASARQTG